MRRPRRSTPDASSTSSAPICASYDIAADRDVALDIRLASDLDQLREKWVDAPMDYLTAAHLAPDGSRLTLTARGQVFVAPVKQGRLVEASRWRGVRYRQARFLPDGKSLVALSDESGEVEWWRLPANGVGAPEQVSRDGTVLRFDGAPSPDGKWIASYDKDHTLWLHSLVDARVVKVATSPIDDFSDLAWSPDSAWLAYVAPADNLFAQIKLVEVASGRTVDATSDRTDSYAPAWSPDGKWLYFLSDRHLESLVKSPWGSRQPEPFLDKPARSSTRWRSRRDSASRSSPTTSSSRRKTTRSRPTRARTTRPAARRSPWSRSRSRRPACRRASSRCPSRPATSSRSRSTARGCSGSLARPARSARLPWSRSTSRDKEPKAKTLVADVKSFELSGDGKRILLRKGDTLAVIDASAGEKVDLDDKNVDLSGWRLTVDPREECRQMFVEAWRLERDYFYDRDMHGVDWPAVLAKYLPLVDRVTDRAELCRPARADDRRAVDAAHVRLRRRRARRADGRIEPASLGRGAGARRGGRRLPGRARLPRRPRLPGRSSRRSPGPASTCARAT